MKLKPMKQLIAGISFSALALVSGSANATGVPVFDGANLLSAIEQLVAWQAQYEQMVAQINGAKQQYDSLTGSRNLGNILNDPALKGVMPADINAIYNAIQQGGSGGLTTAAKALRNASKHYDCDDRAGADKAACQAFLNNNSQTQAFANNGMDVVSQRVTQIQGLQNQISSTADPKAIAELNARLVAESAQVTNDANRIALMKAISEAQDRANQQALKELELKNLAIASNGTDTFTFVAP
jgi:type IV secretion system protein VirB5